MTLAERIVARTVSTPCPITIDRLGRKIVGDCLIWTGAVDTNGYGVITDRSEGKPKVRKVHRVAFYLANGRWPDGVTDHLCRVRPCAQPTHLEDVTDRENLQRGDSGVYNGAKTRCPRGHAYDESNTHWTIDKLGRTGRDCRACGREMWRESNGVALDAPNRMDPNQCINGHPRTTENTMVSTANGKTRRRCRECHRATNQRGYRARDAKTVGRASQGDELSSQRHAPLNPAEGSPHETQ